MTLHGMAPETRSLCYTHCEALRRHREVPLPGIAVTVHRSGTGSQFPAKKLRSAKSLKPFTQRCAGKTVPVPLTSLERLWNRFRWRVTEIRMNLVPETQNSHLKASLVLGVSRRSTHFRACFIHQKISQEAGS